MELDPSLKSPDAPSGPAVSGGRMLYTSPSALALGDVDSYGGCPRKWWFRYVLGEKAPSTAAADLGDRLHSQLAHYLETGENVLDAIASAGVPYLPGPKLEREETFRVEQWIRRGDVRARLKDGSFVPVLGKIDLEHRRKIPALPGVLVHVLDHKTTSDVSSKSMDPESLAGDIQAIVYAHQAAAKYAVEKVSFTHLYYQTRGPRFARPLTRVFSAQETIDKLEGRIWSLSESLSRVAKAERQDDVPFHLPSCRAYNIDCHYLKEGRCTRPSKPSFAGYSPVKGENAVSRLKQFLASSQPKIDSPSAPPVGVLPPDAPPTAAEVSPLPSPPAPQPEPPKAPLAATETDSPKPRGRPKKSNPPESEAPNEATKEAPQAPSRGLKLYVNCLPGPGVKAESLEAYVALLADEVAAKEGVPDLRYVSNDSSLAFGKWKGRLAAEAKLNPPVTGAYFLDTRTCELAQVVTAALAPLCDVGFPVRGV